MRYHGASYASSTWKTYWFEKNLFRDMVAVYNEAGSKLFGYEYDAYGNVTVSSYNGGDSTPANNNPFRYRGYYYDIDLGLYYLNARYYDANVGRFISADNQISEVGGEILGYNLYAYCMNNPVNYSDPSGHFPIVALLIGIALGALFGGITAGVSSALDGNTGAAFLGDVLGGALIGSATGAAFALGGLAGVGMIGTKATIIGFWGSTVASL